MTPRLVSTPAAVERCCICQVCAPVVAVAVAPAPPPAFEPYVIVAVAPPASVSAEMVIVCVAVATVPALDVVYPAATALVDGALQPVGTTSVTVPPLMPPAAAV